MSTFKPKFEYSEIYITSNITDIFDFFYLTDYDWVAYKVPLYI